MTHRRPAIAIAGLLLTGCAVPPTDPALADLDGDLAPFLRAPVCELQTAFDRERFPNVVVSKAGTVLLVFGSSSVRLRRSVDGGASFGPEITIAKGFMGGGVTVDERSGDILAFVEGGHPPAPLTVYRSRDDGRTWFAEPDTVVHPDERGNVPSMHMNEHGITLRHGSHAGRLIRPARSYGKGNARSEWHTHYTTAIYSDDGGRVWHTSAPFPEQGTGEATIAELSDGTLYYNSRVHWPKAERNTRRRCAFSRDGGATWVDWQLVPVLPDGRQDRSYGCMGGLVRLPVRGRDILLFSNLDTPHPRRERITVWASFDGGRTWPIKRLVLDGPSSYSSLAAGRPGTPGAGFAYLHFEGAKGSRLARFNLSWVLGGTATGDGELPTWIRK